MSWEFKRDEKYLERRTEVVNQLQSIDAETRTLLLADFIIMYNSWNWNELITSLKALGVDSGETGSKEP